MQEKVLSQIDTRLILDYILNNPEWVLLNH